MPIYPILSGEFDLPRNVALVDTNVLVAYIYPRDQYHQQAAHFFDESDFELLVAPPVLVESCGMLVSRGGEGYIARLLSWLLTPGNGITIFPAPHPPLDVEIMLAEHSAWMKQYRVDYVDAYLMEIAHRLTGACGLTPHLPIVTLDTRDFYKCWGRGYLYSVFDMRSWELVRD